MKLKTERNEIVIAFFITFLVIILLIIISQIIISKEFLLRTQKTTGQNNNCIGLVINVIKATSSSSTDNIIVRREGSATSKEVKAKIFVNDIYNQTSGTNLDEIYSTYSFSVKGLNPGVDKISAAGILSDGTACGLSQKAEVSSS